MLDSEDIRSIAFGSVPCVNVPVMLACGFEIIIFEEMLFLDSNVTINFMQRKAVLNEIHDPILLLQL